MKSSGVRKRTGATYLSFIFLFSVAYLSAIAQSQEPPVISRAIDYDDNVDPYSGDFPAPVSLVVRGDVRRLKVKAAKDLSKPAPPPMYEIDVKEVLYGGGQRRIVRFTSSNRFQIFGEDMIVALGSGTQIGFEYVHNYSQFPGKPISQRALVHRALARARLDYRVLSATAIFTGKELSGKNGQTKVEVVKPIAGRAPAAGRKIVVKLGPGHRYVLAMRFRTAVSKPIRDGVWLYFVTDILPRGSRKPPLYIISSSIHGDQEEAVRAALKRRDQHPLIPRTYEDGSVEPWRRIAFDGSIAEAAALVGSENQAAVLLGLEKIEHGGEHALNIAVEKIEQTLRRSDRPWQSDLRRTRRLIELLGRIEPDKRQIRGILDRYLQRMASNPPLPESPPDDDWGVESNTPLQWLVRALGEEWLSEEYGLKLLKLQDAAPGKWAGVVKAAVESEKVRDLLELAAARKDAAKFRRQRATVGFQPAGVHIVFTPDSKHAIVDADIYRVSDWQKVGEIPAAKGWRLTYAGGNRYFATGRFENRDIPVIELTFKNGTPVSHLVARLPGETDPACPPSVSADRRVLLTVGKKIRIWDTVNLKLLHTLELNPHCRQACISSDGNKVAMHRQGRLTIVPLNGGKTKKLKYNYGNVLAVRFTPDGRYLMVAKDAYQPELYLLNLAGGYKVESQTKLAETMRSLRLDVSPDSRHVLIGWPDGVKTASLPSLKPLRTISRRTDGFHVDTVAFSPDGSMLGIGSGSINPFGDGGPEVAGNIRLFDRRNFQPVFPVNTHPAHLTRHYYAADGKTIRTFDDQGYICIWDAVDLSLKKRHAPPPGMRVIAVRPEDGRCALYAASSVHLSLGDLPVESIAVVDCRTGEIVSRFNAPVNWFSSYLHWLAGQKLLIRGRKKWRWIDLTAGKVLDDREVDVSHQPLLRDGDAFLTGDRKTLLFSQGYNQDEIEIGRGTTRLRVWTVNASTAEASKPVSSQLETDSFYETYSVPGGKYFCIKSDGIRILRRSDGKQVAHFTFPPPTVIYKVVFSPSGDRFALSTGRLPRDEEIAEVRHPWGNDTTIAVYETLTGKAIAVFSPVETTGLGLRFSPDGSQLLFAGGSEMELCDLPR